MAVDSDAQILALVIQGAVLGVLGAIGYFVRKAFFVIRDSLKKLEDVQDRIGTLEKSDAERREEYQGMRDELFYLKGIIGAPMDQPASAALKEVRP